MKILVPNPQGVCSQFPPDRIMVHFLKELQEGRILDKANQLVLIQLRLCQLPLPASRVFAAWRLSSGLGGASG